MTKPFEPPERCNVAEHFLDRQVDEGRGERIALRIGDRALRYRDIRQMADRFARHLRVDCGVRPEDRVMTALPDGVAFVAAFFGILKTGAVAVMVNPRLQEKDVAALYHYTRARLAIVDRGVEATFAGAAAQAPFLDRLILIGGEGDFDPARREDDAAVFETFPSHRDDPAIWLFSGGTTGRPKAVVQTHRSFVNTAELYARRTLGYREDDVTLSVPKLYFGYATGSNLLFPFAAGGSTVLFPEHPTPERLFEQIARHRPTILINVPTMIGKMVDHPAARDQDLSCLRFATSAGEALPVPLYERWKETFGVELLDGLGTAEMWHVFLTNRPGDVRPGTLGRVVEGFELRIADEDGREVAPGEVGRLWVRGGSRALWYHQNLPATIDAFRGEWFVGGDLVCRDEAGYVTYCGRGDDVLKVGGKWLVPKEVEDCLRRHPAVEECAVIGAEDAAGLTKPYAFVVPRRDAGPELADELKTFALERLDAYKHPRRVILLETFPRTHLGKIDRGKLRALASLDKAESAGAYWSDE